MSDLTCPRCSRHLLEAETWTRVTLDGTLFSQEGTGICPYHKKRVHLEKKPSQGWTEIKTPKKR